MQVRLGEYEAGTALVAAALRCAALPDSKVELAGFLAASERAHGNIDLASELAKYVQFVQATARRPQLAHEI